MQKVNFHILESNDHNGKLRYACRLVHAAWEQGMKISIHTADPAHSSRLDDLLWTFSQSSFIPHATAGAQPLDWDDYPVQIGENADEGAGTEKPVDALINLCRQSCRQPQRYALIHEVVSSDPADKQAARERFRHYRSRGIEPNTSRIS